MRQKQGVFSLFLLSPSSRRAWIEMQLLQRDRRGGQRSPSSRRAWIEIDLEAEAHGEGETVALLAEGVDRNSPRLSRASGPVVALLAEGVDRNIKEVLHIRYFVRVALLAEGVDRNHFAPDARPPKRVALLAEGVDRNCCGVRLQEHQLRSPSSRRAWIEIPLGGREHGQRRSPSSRRAWIEIFLALCASCFRFSRPPRGGRG